MELIHHLLQDNLTSSLTMAGARGESPLSGSEVDGASSPPGNLDLTGDSIILPQDILVATSSLAISSDVEGGGTNPPAPEASSVSMMDLSGLGSASWQGAQDRLISTTLTVDLSRIRLSGLPPATLANARLILQPEGTGGSVTLSVAREREPMLMERGGATGGSSGPGTGALVTGGFRRSTSSSLVPGSATPQVTGSSLLAVLNQRSVGDMNGNTVGGNLVMGMPRIGGLSDVSSETDEDLESESERERPIGLQGLPKPGGASKAGQTKVKTPAQVASKAAKRRRRKDRQQASKAASKEAAALAPSLQNLEVTDGSQPTPSTGGDRKRSTVASGPPAKKSKLESSQAARDLAGWIAGEFDFSLYSEAAKYSPIHRHGPIALVPLRNLALNYSALKEGRREFDISLVELSAVLRDAHGLLLLSLTGPSQSLVCPVGASKEERSGFQSLPDLRFFSSEVLAYGQRVARGKQYRCTQCQSSHLPLPKTKTVLVTGSEVIAAAGLPISLTLPGGDHEHIPWVSPDQCWDSVWVLGGLLSDPFKVIQSIYGTFHGSLVLLLDLGTLPLVTCESASSVFTRLNELVYKLIHSLRSVNKGYTRVFVLPPVIHLGHERLALNQVAIGPFNSLVIAQLLELQRYIDARNSEIMGGYTTTPLHRWGELVSTKFSQMSRDSMNRIIGKVEVRVNPSSTLGVDGVLHLRPEYLHTTVSTLVAFVAAHPLSSW